jgi:hypothetical protein
MPAPTRTLPGAACLEHLRKQAKDLQRDHLSRRAAALRRIRTHLPKLSGARLPDIIAAVISRTDAQLVVAREYGFSSWPHLVEAMGPPAEQVQRLKVAIETGAADAIGELLTEHPMLLEHPFEWTDHNSRGRRITPIRYAHACDQQASFDVLANAGADLEFLGLALWNNVYNFNMLQVQRLLARGVRPGQGMGVARRHAGPQRYEFVNALIEAGAGFPDGPRMDIHRGDLQSLERRLEDDPSLVHELFEDEPHGKSPGCTLLHIAAGHNDLEFVRLLLRHGADINSAVPERQDGSGGQTPIFFTIGRELPRGRYTVTGLPPFGSCREAFDSLLKNGADLSVTARCLLYDEIHRLTPLGFALAQRQADAAHPVNCNRPAVTDREITKLRESGGLD